MVVGSGVRQRGVLTRGWAREKKKKKNELGGESGQGEMSLLFVCVCESVSVHVCMCVFVYWPSLLTLISVWSLIFKSIPQ